MSFDQWLTRIKDCAAVFSSIGAVLAVIWAVAVYFRNQRDQAVSAFRRDLVVSLQYFTEMAASFQNQIVAVLERLFDPKNEEMTSVLRLVGEALAKPNKAEALALMKTEKHRIHETILFSLPAETHGLTHGVRVKFESTIAPLISFSPVLHLFFERAGRLVLAPYAHELSALRIEDYAMDAVEALWDTREAGRIKLATPEDLRMHYRAVIARTMAAYDDDVSLVEIIDAAQKLVREFSREYEGPSLAAQWRKHREDTKDPVGRLKSQSPTDTLRNIINLRLATNAARQNELLAMVANLDALLAHDKTALTTA